MQGLSSTDARSRLERNGPNALPERPPVPAWRRVLRQFASPLIYILLFALAFDVGLWVSEGAHGWPIDAMAISVILGLNAVLGAYQEHRSEAALARLKVLTGAQAWVFRDGALVRVPVGALVVGDSLRVEAGDRVPADGLLRGATGIMVDESLLTGESVPVDKGPDAELFSGTLVVRGRALLEVTRTGASSAMGRLATMLGDIEGSETPLERRVNHLGHQVARWVVALAVGLGLFGILAEGLGRAGEMIIFAVALAVAAVPEGLPAVLTVALALGVERMARHQAVVRRLSAVEALGSVTVIATDKTGTLTENRMDVRSLDAVDSRRALRAMVFANDADPVTGAGDPLDLGLLRYAAEHGIDVTRERATHPRLSDRPFDSEWKFMRVSVTEDGRTVSYLKGAPEVLLARAAMPADDRQSWIEKADAYAREGYRLIALAWTEDEREQELTLCGFAMLWDPPRAEVREAVGIARNAGVRVIMVTGDHPATALAVAHQIGIPGARVMTGKDLDDDPPQELAGALEEVNVFARVRPEQKLDLVRALQQRGEIVAMTGDGVNDAPALKRADVGVAMGQRGSDVSREVADLVLLDDNFATIVTAVEEGRGIYENIQKFLRFLFTTNLSEVVLIAGGAVLAFALGLREADGRLLLPLTAVQILWINLVTDGVPALALAFDRTPGVMRDPPRPPASPLLDRPSLAFVVGAGGAKALLGFAILGLVPWLGYGTDQARAAVFHFMAIGQLFLVYPSRHTATRPLQNPYLHAAVLGGIAVQLAAAFIPVIAVDVLGHITLPIALWALVAAAALLSWALAEATSRIVWRDAQRPSRLEGAS
ncbi:MAG: cation-translocating P-type ATPase [Acidobacteriota bacterium]